MKALRFHVAQIIVLILMGSAIFLPLLGQEKHFFSREVRHAEIAKEMLEDGHYLIPTLLGKPYSMKPPLFNWTVALLFRVTRHINFTLARLPSAVSAVLIALGVYWLGCRWQNATAGFLASAVWLTMPLICEWGRIARADMMLACFIFYGFVLAVLAADSRRSLAAWAYWAAACLLIGMATLSKGPQAIFFFVIMVVVMWRYHRGNWMPSVTFLAIAVVLICVLPFLWGLEVKLHSRGYLGALLAYQLKDSLHQHRQWPLFYIEHLFAMTLPWSIFGIAASYSFVRRFRRREHTYVLIAPLILIIGLVIMTVFPNKRDHYMLPILPLWALFIGMFLARQGEGSDAADGDNAGQVAGSSRVAYWLVRQPLFIILGGFAIGGLAASIILVWLMPAAKLITSLVCLLIAALGAYGARASWHARRAAAVWSLVSTVFITAVAWHPIKYELSSDNQEIVAIRNIDALLPVGARVVDYRTESELLDFKSDRAVTHIWDDKSLHNFLSGKGDHYVFLQSKDRAEMNAVAGHSLRQLGTWREGKRKIIIAYEVLTN